MLFLPDYINFHFSELHITKQKKKRKKRPTETDRQTDRHRQRKTDNLTYIEINRD